MTYAQWLETAVQVRERAERIRLMRVDRARKVWNAAFGVENQGAVFFLYAHNWFNLPTLTPEQRRACRFVRHMDTKQWEPSRIADRITSRTWLEHCRTVHGYKG